jgi:glycosyltransferase involved in cell wall biosynthesis
VQVAIVTPYFKEPDATLERCLASVRRQSQPATHILVADGQPRAFIDLAGVRHLRLDRAHGDAGNAARGLGALLAVAEEFDAIAFLDADNWLDESHVATCLEAARGAAELPDFVVARRRLMRPDGSVLCESVEEDERGQHIDTNCLFLLRPSFHTAARWATMPKALYEVGDRVFLKLLLAEQLRASRCAITTVNYSCTWRSPYLAANEEPPASAKPDPDPADFNRWWRSLDGRQKMIASRLVGFPLVKGT